MRKSKRELNLDSQMMYDELVEQTVSNLACSSFTYNMKTKQVCHKFLKSTRPLESHENAHISLESQTEDVFIKMEPIPYGIMFQAVYVDKQWVFASPNNCYLNDKCFGS
jgi:hypothetical protein